MTEWQRNRLRYVALILALGLITTIYLFCNLDHVQFAATVSTNAPDVAQVYYARDGRWNEQESVSIALTPGTNEIRFELPGFIVGNAVRFDPGRRATTYRISSIHWVSGNSEITVPLVKVTNLRSDASTISLAAGTLELVARDGDSQLSVPTPNWTGILSGVRWPLIAPFIVLVFVVFALRRRVNPQIVAGGLLGICAVFYFAATLAIGPRLPLFDDWRYVLPGPFNLIDGSWQWLTVSGNDTYFLTNQVLDFFVLKLSNVDFFWIRAVAATLLLLQLALQYGVISRSARNFPAVGAVAVSLGIWSLAEGAYWGGTAIAYQQALPTLFGTMMLLQLISPDGSIRSRNSLILLAVCSIASGLAYISGGMMILSLGMAYLLATGLRRATKSEIRVGILLLSMGVVLLVLQFSLVSIRQGSLLEHTHHAASVYPNDRRFWLFFFALYGRALGYGGTWTPVDMLLTGLVLFPPIVLCLQQLRFAFKGGVSDTRPTWIFLALYAGIASATYAGSVAFGRSGFADANLTANTITAMAKARFHFWPVAAMLPYAWLGWSALLQRARVRTGATAAAVFIGAIMLAPKSLPLLDQVSALRSAKGEENAGARCAATHLANADAVRSVVCTNLTGTPNDIGSTLIHLRTINSPIYESILKEGQTHSP